eukprot:gene7495-9211_t
MIQLRGRAGSLSPSRLDPKNMKDLENYYKLIQKNVLEHQFEFTVKKNDEKNRNLIVNLKEHNIQIFKITKDKKNNRLLKIEIQRGKKEISLLFANTERREYFYELVWLSKSNKSLPTDEVKAEYEKISLFITTWNVGDAVPNFKDFESWIPRNSHDIYVIGVQECEYTPMKGGNGNNNNKNSDCEDDWFALLSAHLGHAYFRLESTSLVKMRLAIFSRKEHFYKLQTIEKTNEATGIGGVYGNKGAVLISFQFLETSFCFVSSHFAAHQEKVDHRNNNFKDIVKGVSLGAKYTDILNQFHHIFWLGDLNYRIDLLREEVLLHIKKSNWTRLLIHDQLIKQKSQEKVFVGFKEPPITFAPTYKMERGQSRKYTDEKQRVPSWCDRILHKSLPYTQAINCLKYNSAETILTSDHVPVYGIFDVYVQLPCLPIPPTILKEQQSSCCTINLLDMRAENLDFIDDDKEPDPFLCFHANSFVESEIITGHASNNRSPFWGDIPPILPIIKKKSFLETQHLLITIYHDNDSRYRLGHATIPLALGFTTDDEPFQFATRITKNGLNAGILYGKIHIHYQQPSSVPNSPPLSAVTADKALNNNNNTITNNINNNNNNNSQMVDTKKEEVEQQKDTKQEDDSDDNMIDDNEEFQKQFEDVEYKDEDENGNDGEDENGKKLSHRERLVFSTILWIYGADD